MTRKARDTDRIDLGNPLGLDGEPIVTTDADHVDSASNPSLRRRHRDLQVGRRQVPADDAVDRRRALRGLEEQLLDVEIVVSRAETAGEVAHREIRRMAVETFKACQCQGMARVDFFVNREGDRIWVNELNTIPGFTATSVYAKLFEASGIPYPELVDRLVQLALDRHERRSRLRF